MAKGDAVGTSISIGATSSTIYIPSGTTEILVRILFGVGSNTYHFGTSPPAVLAQDVLGSNGPINVSCFISNSFPLKMTNDLGTSQILGFSGIQTK